ncbi:MAG: hypothetical protein WBX00_26325 [Isosphaeraceae bacterium]
MGEYAHALRAVIRHRGSARQGEFSTPAPAEKLGISEQTVHLDVLLLKQRGYLFRSVRRSAGWAYQLRDEPATVTSETKSSST